MTMLHLKQYVVYTASYLTYTLLPLCLRSFKFESILLDLVIKWHTRLQNVNYVEYGPIHDGFFF